MTRAIDKAIRLDRDALVAELEQSGGVIRGGSVKCPFHDDRSASGSVHEDRSGVWRYTCHAGGCGFSGDIHDVRSQATGQPIVTPPTRSTRVRQYQPKVYANFDEVRAVVKGKLEAKYSYTDPNTGSVDLIVLRFRLPDGAKTFRQARPVKDGVVLQAPQRPWPLYNRARIRNTDRVIVVEGEKCVHALHDIDVVATTSPAGAGKAEYADWSPLAGKTVSLWPDNDGPGVNHMRDVAGLLEQLDPSPRVFWLNPSKLGLQPKGDVADFLASMGSQTPEAQRQAVKALLDEAEPMGAGRDVQRLIEDVISGQYSAVTWPWEQVGQLTNALLPGTVTLICGDPGDGKSFMLLQAIAYWFGQRIPLAVYELEESREYHLRRILAQLEKDSNLVDNDWCKANPQAALEATRRHADTFDQLGRCIWVAPDKQVTLPDLVSWTKERAKAGCRIIAIDPVTSAAVSDRQWVEDSAFMADVKKIITDYGASLLLVTHPRKGRQLQIGLDYLAGGAAYARFSQTAMWLERHKTPKSLQVTTCCGTCDMSVNRTLHLCKTRNGRGHGLSLAFDFRSESLLFAEQGIICKNNG